jgi:hypothetical protein
MPVEDGQTKYDAGASGLLITEGRYVLSRLRNGYELGRQILATILGSRFATYIVDEEFGLESEITAQKLIGRNHLHIDFERNGIRKTATVEFVPSTRMGIVVVRGAGLEFEKSDDDAKPSDLGR